MSRKRNHRMRERRISLDPMRTAIIAATRLSEAEISEAMAPLHALAKAFREGVATEEDYQALRIGITISLAIEGSGIVRGLSAHFTAAIAALDAVAARARATGTWVPHALRFDELDAIDEVVWLQREQLRRLSAGELRDIVQRLECQTRAADHPQPAAAAAIPA